MKQTRFVVLCSLFLVCAAALAQQPVCLTMPADSPVLSTSPDDVPATGTDILTYTGAHAKARANQSVSFVQISDTEQKIWFAPDGAPGLHKCFYNRRYRADTSSPWYWEWSVSPVVIELPPASSSGPSSVLYSASPKYKDTRTNTSYKYLMFQIVQPSGSSPTGCDGSVGGFLFLAFSNDGICWTDAQQAVTTGGPSFPCFPGHTQTVPTSQVAAFDDGGQIQLISMEGDEGILKDTNNMSLTETKLMYSFYTNPSQIGLSTTSQLTFFGMVSPMLYNSYGYILDRYTPYYYFFNMSAAYDAAAGDLYISRAYPYPFDRVPAGTTSLVPQPWQANVTYLTDPATGQSSPVTGCNDSPQVLPNRVQIYRKHIGALSNLADLATGSLTFVSDLGGPNGYSNSWQYGIATATPLGDPRQTNASRDYGTLNFIRDGQGNLIRNGGPNYLAADTFKLNKSNGQQCQVTGLERVIAGTLP